MNYEIRNGSGGERTWGAMRASAKSSWAQMSLGEEGRNV